MEQISTIGLDIAKNVFQVHGIDETGKVVVRRQLRRRQVLCRFLGRRVAVVERGSVFAGVREAPRHEIAGAVRGGFRQSYGESAGSGRASGTPERPVAMDVVLSRIGLDRGSLCGERRIGRLRTGLVRRSCRWRTADPVGGGLSDRSWRTRSAEAGS